VDALRRRRAPCRGLALVAAALLAAAAPAAAESIRIDAVGSVPLGAGSAGGASARQAALEAGVRDAVQRAARDLAHEAGVDASDETLAAAIGSDSLAYAASYRILEDRGERAPLLETTPGAQSEYVVTVEVEVEGDKLRARLMQAGLLGAPAHTASARPLQVELQGVGSYALWERIERALGARGGAVRPLEFDRGRILAELVTDETPQAVLGRLADALGDAATLRPLGGDPDALHVEVVPRPPAEPPAAGRPPPVGAPDSPAGPPGAPPR
jgi:hypothetical protein